MHVRRVVVATLALCVFGGSKLAGQSAADIVSEMLDAYESRIANVDNYTVTQTVMGFETVTRFEKEVVNGRPVFRTRSIGAGGMEMNSPATGVDDVYAMGEELAARARYLGRERINDYDVHVLDVTDLSDTAFGRNVTQESEFEPTRGRVYLDVDTYAPRQFVFEGEMTRDGNVVPLTATMEMGDYREIEGMLIPYRMLTTIEGLGAAIDPETRAQFEQMQRELDAMPEAQRRMVESMMADQMKQFEAMMSDDSAPMMIEVIVTSVQVNTPG